MSKTTDNFLTLVAILWLSVLTVMTIMLKVSNQPRIGFLDTQFLVTNQAQKIGALYPNGKLPPDKLQLLADKIKDSVTLYAKENNLVLLAKGAIWGGEVVDYTDRIIDALRE